LALAWVYEKTGSLIPGIFLHAVNNGLAFLALLVMKGSGLLPG
jgi:membrane protease YdiL (CAAX protease family)